MEARTLTSSLIVTALIAMAPTGCGDDSTEPAEELPPADGAQLWSYLTEENYDATWSLWPGRGERYAGTEPHGMLLTTYVNELALHALEAGATVLPAGAMVVKENYTPDGALVAITTMYKVSGFDPAHDDWFWLKNDPAGVIEAEGKVESCTGCHAGAADFDFLWTLKNDRR